jgi:transcriptional regulator
MLNEEYQKLLEMEIKGCSRVQMALELNCSEAKLDIMIKNLKEKIKKVL